MWSDSNDKPSNKIEKRDKTTKRRIKFASELNFKYA